MLSLLNSPLGFATTPPQAAEQNPCRAGKAEMSKVDMNKSDLWKALANVQCSAAIAGGGVQSGADVTEGSIGTLTAGLSPITASYASQDMCPVNVHWHLGAEHKNDGTYSLPPPTNLVANTGRRLASTNEAGHWCPAVTDASINMVDNYVFKHCTDMHVGYTYEIHWPHSTLGACGTKWQYQSHFMDGVLCAGNQLVADGTYDVASALSFVVTEGANGFTDRAHKIGVQAQVFTLTNDPAHDYPAWDMMTGFNKDLATNVAIYQGSTTGQKNGNNDCRGTGGAVTWQVDRGCHMISAKAMDGLCKQMGMQADDMHSDMHPHNSRVTTSAAITTSIAMPAGVDAGGGL